MHAHQSSPSLFEENFKLAQEAVEYARSFIQHTSTLPSQTKEEAMVQIDEILKVRKRVLSQEEIVHDLYSIPDHPYVKILKRYKKGIKQHHAGNCGEYADLLMNFFRKRGVSADCFLTGKDHMFVVIGRAHESDPNRPKTWGEQAVICDPLNSTPCYPVNDIFKELKTFHYSPYKEKPNIYHPYKGEKLTLQFSFLATKDKSYQKSLVQQTVERLTLIKSGSELYISDSIFNKELNGLINKAFDFNIDQKIDSAAEIELNTLIRQAHALVKQYVPEEKIETAKKDLIEAMIKFVNTKEPNKRKKIFHDNLQCQIGGIKNLEPPRKKIKRS